MAPRSRSSARSRRCDSSAGRHAPSFGTRRRHLIAPPSGHSRFRLDRCFSLRRSSSCSRHRLWSSRKSRHRLESKHRSAGLESRGPRGNPPGSSLESSSARRQSLSQSPRQGHSRSRACSLRRRQFNLGDSSFECPGHRRDQLESTLYRWPNCSKVYSREGLRKRRISNNRFKSFPQPSTPAIFSLGRARFIPVSLTTSPFEDSQNSKASLAGWPPRIDEGTLSLGETDLTAKALTVPVRLASASLLYDSKGASISPATISFGAAGGTLRIETQGPIGLDVKSGPLARRTISPAASWFRSSHFRCTRRRWQSDFNCTPLRLGHLARLGSHGPSPRRSEMARLALSVEITAHRFNRLRRLGQHRGERRR